MTPSTNSKGRTMKDVDVSHLEAGMRVTLAYRQSFYPVGYRLSATLVSDNGASLWTEGGVPVRMPDGSAGPGVREVLDPLPPVKIEPLPVGTRKRSPEGVEAVLTNDGDSYPWMVYKAGETTDWLAHKDVADWGIIPDASARAYREGEDGMTPEPNVDVSHLEAGMRVTLAHSWDGYPGSDRLSSTLVSYNGALWTEGGVLVRMPDGHAALGVLEVLDPLPPVKIEPLPVGTRKRSASRCPGRRGGVTTNDLAKARVMRAPAAVREFLQGWIWGCQSHICIATGRASTLSEAYDVAAKHVRDNHPPAEDNTARIVSVANRLAAGAISDIAYSLPYSAFGLGEEEYELVMDHQDKIFTVLRGLQAELARRAAEAGEQS